MEVLGVDESGGYVSDISNDEEEDEETKGGGGTGETEFFGQEER